MASWLLTGPSSTVSVLSFQRSHCPCADWVILADPKYEEEVSGCTASVGIITHDKIYVVCCGYQDSPYLVICSDFYRVTLGIRGPFLE